MAPQNKILVYSTQLLETGGIESHLLEFCKHISASGVAIDLVVLNSKMLPETEVLYKEICNKVYLGNQGRSRFRLFWLLKVCLLLRIYKYKALYTNGQGESIKMLGALIRRSGAWVHHHHTSGDTDDQKTWKKNYLNVLNQATTVIACSNRNAKDMELFLMRSIDSIPCFSRKINVHNRQRQKGQPVKFGYYGRLIPEKGIDILCKLSEDHDLPDIEFHIWGEGTKYPEVFFDSYKKVQFHGTFSGLKELTEAISSLDAFLLLSVHPEGLPISLLEAMSAGLPWLATDKGGIPDIACDPLSTRVLPAESSYEDFKRAVHAFAEDLAHGRVSKDLQEQLYKEKFSSSALTMRWKQALGMIY